MLRMAIIFPENSSVLSKQPFLKDSSKEQGIKSENESVFHFSRADNLTFAARIWRFTEPVRLVNKIAKESVELPIFWF